MATQKDKILVGDTYAVSFIAERPSSDGLSWIETAVQSAYVELWDNQASAYVSLGVIGPSGVGVAATIDDSLISYILPADKTTVASDYKLYITGIFADSQIITELRQFKVLARR